MRPKNGLCPMVERYKMQSREDRFNARAPNPTPPIVGIGLSGSYFKVMGTARGGHSAS